MRQFLFMVPKELENHSQLKDGRAKRQIHHNSSKYLPNRNLTFVAEPPDSTTYIQKTIFSKHQVEKRETTRPHRFLHMFVH